jgi:folate-binding protein YgfZ
VQVRDVTDRHARLGCAGPRAADIAAELGVSNFRALPTLTSVPLNVAGTVLVRHDFAGLPGLELLVPRGEGAAWWDRLVEAGAAPAGFVTLDVLRIEAGIPWLGRDLDEQVVAPESGQVERGISYQKGCYLGHEVIERMRSRGAQARRLVRLRMEPGAELPLPVALRQGGVVGRITSLVAHPIEPARVGLGYLKTSITDYSGLTAGDPPQAVTIVG